jgi:hypothetical protein
MPRKLACFSAILLCAAASGGAALAVEKVFPKPKQGGDRLDWCLNWGTDCGKPVAEVFCKAKGYAKSTGYGMAADIGGATPTRLITTGAVCDQPYCDGFSYIKCFKPGGGGATASFGKPKYKGNRLDWCVNWSVGCGQEAATAWCKTKGFAKAVGFKMAPDIGVATPTRLIGTGAVCDQGFCDGFTFITCGS